jgi:ATP-dependent DNA helicase RecG
MDYIVQADENKLFDRKSAKIKVADLAPLICAFANAQGGTIVIGVNDKTRKIEGINTFGEDKINSFIVAPKDCCRPMPPYQEEFLDVINEKGKQDRLLLLHIDACPDQMIRTINDSVFLRIADRTKEMKGDDLRNLEYNKSVRHYEDECNPDATIADMDVELLNMYRERLHATELSYEQILSARGFIKEQNGKKHLTNAAVLLFSRNIMQFYPNCRVRFVRYEGDTAKTGASINISKDYSIDLPLLRLIDRAKDFVGSQLREFTTLNQQTGRFEIVPEYPEFAWLEGIVNAVTHREYALSGACILVSMYDDRLEIESPGKLPGIVTVDNIRTTRYARNPKISRVLTEFGYVRELNEGVKRIYSDMEQFFLDDPVYSDNDINVKLILKNNIVMRSLRRQDSTKRQVGEDIWEQLDDLEKQILVYMANHKYVNRAELEEYTTRSGRTINARLNRMISMGIIKSNGTLFDPKRSYSIVY